MFRNDTLALVEQAKAGLQARIEINKEKLLACCDRLSDPAFDIYSDYAFFALYNDVHVEEALGQVARTAKWFDIPHPHGRDPRGESTFAAMSLLQFLYRCPEKLTKEARELIDTFFLRRNFESMYESENHRLQHHTAVYLIAQFYEGEYFEHMGKSAEELVKEEEEYLFNFLDFRARRGWGEFDSTCYLAVDMKCLIDLYDFSKNEKLREMSRMMMDILLVYMAVDSRNGLWGGAHGRIYQNGALNAASDGFQTIYALYFGGPLFDWAGTTTSLYLLSDYRPSDIVYQIALGRQGDYVSRKGHHLHCIPAADLPGVISKYNYVSEKYVIGAINRQDKYPEESPQIGYAHHEQHELDAMITTHPMAKVFTHHPGRDEHNEHNRWTGDIGCRCVQTFCDRNVAMATYDTHEREPIHHVNAYMLESMYDEVRIDGEWAFCTRDGVCIGLYGNGGWTYTDWFFDKYSRLAYKGEKCRVELVSPEGLKHGCVIEISDQDESFDAFIERVKGNQVRFNPEDMSLEYTSGGRTLYMKGQERKVNGCDVKFPYDTFDCPYVQAKRGETKMYLTGFDRRAVYDFGEGKAYDADTGEMM